MEGKGEVRFAAQAALDRWKGQGWQLKLLPLQRGTRYAARLASRVSLLGLESHEPPSLG